MQISKRIPAYCLAVLCLVYCISCGTDGKTASVEKKKIDAVPVEISSVQIGDLAAVFSGSANLEAENEAVVVAKASGVIKKIFVEEGEFVKQGQVLVKLDDEQQLYRFNQSRANLNKIKNEYERNEQLFNKNLISKDTFEKVKYELESMQAAFDLAKLELNYTSIKASIGGVISERYIKTGNMIKTNDPAFKITDFDPLMAVLFVPERHISLLKNRQPVKLNVDAVSDEKFKGHIERISPVVDPNSGTFKVTIEVHDPQRNLKPGMFGRVQIMYDEHKNTLMIPKEAIISEDRETSVFVVRDTAAYRQTVSVGYSNSTHTEILEGLKNGDSVVTIGQNSLKDSSRIQIVSDSTAVQDLAASN